MRRQDIASSLILVPINRDSEAFASLFLIFKFTDRISSKKPLKYYILPIKMLNKFLDTFSDIRIEYV
jgi:hypothetical protein